MAEKSTFKLNLPRNVLHETYRVQLADGSIVTRTADQLTAAPSLSPAAPRG